MSFIKFAGKIFLCITLFSCYSSPKKANDLIDYSDALLSKMIIYDIGIDILNRDIVNLKQNIFNEIIQNEGNIMQEEILTINRYRIVINMPKNNTAEFIRKIRKFGIVVNETMHGNDVRDYFANMDMNFMNIKNMLEKYNNLLKNATEISDKILLEKEINNAQMDIESLKRTRAEMEFRLENITIGILMYNK